MHRRSALLLVLAVALAGCLTAPTGTSTEGPTSATPTDPSTSKTPTTVTTDHAAKNPHADHSVYVQNEGNAPVDVVLRVVNEDSGEVVHEESWTESPSGEHEVYNLQRADPDGVERFRVTLELGDGRSETLHLESSACYGDAFFTVTESGDLDSTYSIC